MGFYGNISNVNKSTFQFDKIYPNRAAMEQFCNSDGIFVGRYVLVDYNLDTSLTDIKQNKISNSKVSIGYDFYTLNPRGQKELVHWANGGPVLFSGAGSDVPYYGFGGIAINEGDYILVVGSIVQKITVDFPPIYGDEESNPHINAEDVFELTLAPSLYICESIDENGYPKFELVSDSSVDNIYILNHKIDSQLYGDTIGRGWDSTVWQKTYKDGKICYVMVAELNSVVPTFDISADAPTAVPLVPHWGSDSSNVYYKLHMQPQWGFRIKESKKGEFTSDNAIYPSDVTGDFITSVSINDNTKAIVSDSYESNLAIYFNKNGFDKNIESSLAGDLKRQHLTINEDDVKDIIKVSPTGYSGNKYNKHPGVDVEKAIDTYELSLLLPSLGTSISEMWNMVYGKGTSRDARGRLLYNKETGLFATEDENGKVDLDNALRNTNIVWNNINGHRLINTTNGIDYEYNSELMDSLAAGINTVHDLIGQIIIDTEKNFDNIDNWDPTKIYYINNKFYQKYQEYIPTNDQYQKVSGKVVENLNGYYREDIHEFPDLSDEKILTDSEKGLGKTSYSNYIKTINDKNIVDGAIYYTINDLPETDISSQLLLTKPTENEDSLYKKVKNENIISYKKASNLEDQSLNAETGEYFKITSTAVTQEEFYIPNRYYIAIASSENGEFNRIIQCTEQNLVAAKAAAGITSDTPTTSYQFYRGITKVNDATTGVWIIDESNPIIRKNVSLPENHYLYDAENKKLTIFGDIEQDVLCEIFDDSSKKEHINFKEDPINPNSLIIDSYDAFTYEVEGDNINSWTLWEIYSKNQSLGENEKIIIKKDGEGNYVQAYGLKRGTAPTTYSLQDAVLVNNLVDFEENKYYYHDNAYDEYTLETLDGLKTEQGYAKNINHLYCTISVVSVGIYYSIVEQLYYQNTSADWIRETAVKINVNDAGKTYKQSDPTQIEHNSRYYKLDNLNLTKIGELNLFKSNVYYDVGGNLITEYINGIDYYKKTNGYKTQWIAKELPQIATSLNTMLGLILRTNRMLADGDDLTRNRATVQGAINSLNDIIGKFDELVPISIMTINRDGKFRSGNLQGDSHITIEITQAEQSDIPELKISHKTLSVTTNNNYEDNNNKYIAQLTLDDAGHISGIDKTALPNAFKTVSIENGNQVNAKKSEDTITLIGDDIVSLSIDENDKIKFNVQENLSNWLDSWKATAQAAIMAEVENSVDRKISNQINKTTIETNFWGTQVPLASSSNTTSLAVEANMETNLSLDNTSEQEHDYIVYPNHVSYGRIIGRYEMVEENENQSVLKIVQNALYKVQASLNIIVPESDNINTVTLKIMQKKAVDGSPVISTIGSITESLDEDAAGKNIVIGTPARLVQLNDDDEIYLTVISDCNVNVSLESNDSYLLIEKVENLLHKVSYIYESDSSNIIWSNNVTPPVYARYSVGEEVEIAEAPSESSHSDNTNVNGEIQSGTWSFVKWVTEDGEDLPNKVVMPDDNITIKGLWHFTEDPYYTVSYSYGGNNIPSTAESLPNSQKAYYRNIGDVCTIALYELQNPEIDIENDGHYSFNGWSLNNELQENNVEISDDCNFIGSWTYTEQTWPIIYRYEGTRPESAELPTDANTYGNNDTPTPVDPPATLITSIEDHDLYNTEHGYASGTWTFNGWTWANPDAHNTNPIFTGSWSFEQDTSISLKYKIMYEYKGIDSSSTIIDLSNNEFESSISQSYYTLNDILLDSDIPSRDAEIKIGNNLYAFRNWATSNRFDSNHYDDISTKLNDRERIGSYFDGSYGNIISNWPSILTIYGIYQIPQFTIGLYDFATDSSEPFPDELSEWQYGDSTVYPYYYEVKLPTAFGEGDTYIDNNNWLWRLTEWRKDNDPNQIIHSSFYITENISNIKGYWTYEGEVEQ